MSVLTNQFMTGIREGDFGPSGAVEFVEQRKELDYEAYTQCAALFQADHAIKAESDSCI